MKDSYQCQLFLAPKQVIFCTYDKDDNDKTGHFIGWIFWAMNEKDMLIPHLKQVLQSLSDIERTFSVKECADQEQKCLWNW